LSNKHTGGSQLAGIKILALELWKNSNFSFEVKSEKKALKNLAMQVREAQKLQAFSLN
jgi:hypothetical protein